DSTAELDLDEIRKQEPLGLSPIDKTRVYETPVAYMSESALEGDREKGLRIGKVILGRRIDREHVEQLLTRGRTELINGFISRKKRPFDAYLLLDDKGKLTFEFPPRRKKGGKARAANS
ncbi:MAG TPA: DNA topoisomerase III, partial [Desulfobulbus sp.]|nr:DNA topoisomerase III [Desulfobulbus sp.]